MSRLPRIYQENATYHIAARINRREMIFDSVVQQNSDLSGDTTRNPIYQNNYFKTVFLETVAQCKKKYSFQLRSFCIMGNHVHLLIKPIGNESISKIMQWILSVFARRFNKYFNYSGHVWYDRFKSKIIESFTHLINTHVYINNNPIRARIANSPFEYEFNSISHYLKLNFRILDEPDEELHLISQSYIQRYSFDEALTHNSILGFNKNRW